MKENTVPMKSRRLLIALVGLLLVGLLAGCGGNDPAGDSGAGEPAQAVMRYLEAKVAADRDALGPLLCASMEGDLDREANSFASIDARLEDVTCTRGDEGGTDSATVSCTGAIVAVYNGEDTSFPLRSYRVVLEGGEWRWCGEAE